MHLQFGLWLSGMFTLAVTLSGMFTLAVVLCEPTILDWWVWEGGLLV